MLVEIFVNLQILCNENINIIINDDVFNTYNMIEKHPPSLFVEKAFYLPHQMIHKLVLVYSYMYVSMPLIITHNVILTSEYLSNVDVL